MAKKKLSKETAVKYLSPVPEEYIFWVFQGPVLRSSYDLLSYLEKDSRDDQFKYHVNKDKNDFANWVSHVYGHPELGDKMDAATTRRDLLIQILKYLLVEYKTS